MRFYLLCTITYETVRLFSLEDEQFWRARWYAIKKLSESIRLVKEVLRSQEAGKHDPRDDDKGFSI